MKFMLALWLSLLLLIIFHSHVISCVSLSKSQCHPDERTALLGFNPTLGRNSGSTDCCKWEGVECDETTGHVTGLQVRDLFTKLISENNSLFSLRHLQKLVVNSFMGLKLSISKEAFNSLSQNFTNLKELELRNVNMSLVPLSSLTNLSSSLETLSLFANGLRGEFPDLGFHFPNLQELSIRNNDGIKFSEAGVKSLAQNTSNLRELHLSDVNMSSVPLESLVKLPSSLTHLRLISCLLNGELPNNFFDSFPRLELLILSDNNLSGQVLKEEFAIPPSNLTTLYLSNNAIHGSIPSWMLALPKLEQLYLDKNQFSGEIPHIRTSSLVYLVLDDNQLEGFIPRSLFQQESLIALSLLRNSLKGTLEIKEFSKLQNLTYLYLSFNNLTLIFNESNDFTLPNLFDLQLSSCNIVEFPGFLKSLNTLEYLDLSNNQLKGRVPAWLWEMGKDSFVHLNLSHNSLTYIDRLPWNKLTYLDLQSNSFSGTLPILSSSLDILSLSKNQFSGEIPTSICNLTNPSVLDLSSNNLTGEIPPCIGNLSSYLSVLDLRNNKLRGVIPTTFMEGNRLRTLNLNGNQLDGTIPRSLVNCSSLEVLDLGNNLLSDSFPEWLESLPELQVLVLRGNKFHGSIGNPKSLGSPFAKLRIMDLSRNAFTGDLPTKYFEYFKAMMSANKNEMGFMGESYYQDSVVVTIKGFEYELVKILTIFTTIDFSKNNFSGGIPEILGKLVSLKGLNLSHNMLTGTLPSSLGNLNNLEWLDLSFNEFVGKIPSDLACITTLSLLNLSHNHLEGPIPKGKQFNTFGNDSFIGNLNLCGFPVSKSCGEDTEPSTPTLALGQEDDDSSITNGFSWRIVMIGFASGLVIAVSIGYMLLYSNGKLHWLSETIVVEIQCAIARRKRARRSLRRR